MQPQTELGPQARILIVEDDDVFRALIKKHLDKFGYSVNLARDGLEALRTLDSNDEIRLVLTDMSMPNMSGLDFIKAVRAREDKPYVYMIVVSAYARINDIVKGIEGGADDYLSKPLSFAELEARIRIGQRIIELESRLVRAAREQAELAKRDYLTGLYNRRHIYDIGAQLFNQGRRYGHRLSALVVDVDRFKVVNDNYGHAIGDETLVALARRMSKKLRNVDLLGRMGGEEFIVLMPETDGVGALKVAERIRAEINGNPIQTSGPTLRLTVSQGLASQSNRVPDLDALIKKADSALYTSKREGRNRISVAP